MSVFPFHFSVVTSILQLPELLRKNPEDEVSQRDELRKKSAMLFNRAAREEPPHTSGLQRLAGVYDPPESCDIPINAEFDGDYHGGIGETGNG